MNKLTASIAFTLTLMAVLPACTTAPKGDQAIITAAQKAAIATGKPYTADTTASKIRFTGHGVGKNHPGNFRLSSGTVGVANNQVTSGQFIIDIQSMEMEEKEERFQTKLRSHLLSKDFFDATTFSTATFEITKVEPYQINSTDTSIIPGANFTVSGNFTLKNVTQNITFPAKIDVDGKILKAKANFDIDRTRWQMNYGNNKSLKDKFIAETVNIELDLQAQQ
jgi:polyisoprenoid-binding protein YceI